VEAATAGGGTHTPTSPSSDAEWPSVVGRVARDVGLGAAEVFLIFYAVVRVAYEEFYRLLGLTPEQVGIGQAAMVARTGAISVVLGLAIASWITVAVVAYRVVSGLRGQAPVGAPGGGALARFARRYETELRLMIVLVIGVCLVLALAYLFRHTYVPLWLSGGLSSVAIGCLVGETRAILRDSSKAEGKVQQIRNWVSAAAPIRLWALVLLGAAVFGLAFSIWGSGEEAGRELLRTGVVSQRRFGHLYLQAAPARIVPLGTDPLAVCDEERTATLLGRSDQVTFVLVRGAAGSHEVMPLRQTDYAVVTGVPTPQSCRNRP
jgi:hypothetical protein